MTKKPLHSFHIPVMGLAYTIDSPIRIAQYGISSVISIIDDEIIEKMKNFYSKKFNLNYPEILIMINDYRAKRITDYLNMIDDIINEKFKTFKLEISRNTESLKHFIAILPNSSEIKSTLQNLLENRDYFCCQIKNFIEKNLVPGNIDVNIMTKVDKDNFIKNEQLPIIYNVAHASLRGFANSKLSSLMVLSAGMNPRLYSCIEEFEDFFQKGTSNEILKNLKATKNKYGSSCPKKLLALNKEYSLQGICTASKKYQEIKLNELEKKAFTIAHFKKKEKKIKDKSCLCVGLVNSAYIENNLTVKGEKQGVVICPGPNLAYFDKETFAF